MGDRVSALEFTVGKEDWAVFIVNILDAHLRPDC